MSSIASSRFEPGSPESSILNLATDPAEPLEEDILTADHYEILRVSPVADEETIERVYRTLAFRFHPDNPSTGDPETYLRIREAYETLCDPVRRAQYNLVRQRTRFSVRFRLRGREFFDGVRGEQNRRLAALCLLYRQRISSTESPGLTLLDLEQLTGCTREELSSAVWYLCEKHWVKFGELTEYSITAEGFDVVESKLDERLEFRDLATLRYYGSPRHHAETSAAVPALADNSLKKIASGDDPACHALQPLPLNSRPREVAEIRTSSASVFPPAEYAALAPHCGANPLR